MTLRTRFACTLALVALLVATAVGLLSYAAASSRIYDEIDQSLRTLSAAVAAGQTQVLAVVPTDGPDDTDGPGGGPRRGTGLVAQTVAADGTVTRVGGRPVALPVGPAELALAASGREGATATTQVQLGRTTFRVLATALPTGDVLQVGTDVDATVRVLAGMARQIALTGVAVVLAAAAAGWLVAQRVTRRLVRLTGLAEEVSASGSLHGEVPVEGRDEVGRLAGSFRTMLDRLARAREAQNRLVEDAAHELRTPLTSLRTNASVLRRIAELSPAARDRLVDDVQSETRELSHLVEELVELALAERPDEPEDTVDLLAVAREAAARVHRRTGRETRVEGRPTPVWGRRGGLDRAVGNMVENAAKFDAAGTEPVEVRVGPEGVTVADRGPGIAEADLEKVFDRFHRADTARGLPGSGLGLSIVRDVAATHGGTVFARTREGGGAEVGFTVGSDRLLPGSEPD
ncbi:HAMP domain-containing sensor histidine kinase [Pseudonocardia xishanensis]|uniref:histidine kinase n=1 Tax=Pseudonocardia xishanensis TaxID=630995 RepID=A0ABP8RSE6_9PSEU